MAGLKTSLLTECVARLVVIPLSYLRRLDSLKYTSIAALVSMAYLTVLVVYHFVKGDTMADRGNVNIIQWAGPVPALSSLPVIVFAFTCHQNVWNTSPGSLLKRFFETLFSDLENETDNARNRCFRC